MRKGVMILLAAVMVLGCTYTGMEGSSRSASFILENGAGRTVTETAPDMAAEEVEETQAEAAQAVETPAEESSAPAESEEESQAEESRPQEENEETSVTEESAEDGSDKETDQPAPAEKKTESGQTVPEKKPADTGSQTAAAQAEAEAQAAAAAQAEAAAQAAAAAQAEAASQNPGEVTEVSRTYIEDCGEDSGYWEIIYSDGSVEYIDG